ncbi:hypothetical protein SAMN05421733_102249 [Acinetobacter boissieri]|uniref:Uncharacterized protein n=1 Tax=Acinetobacter boissieri TaxID=1219383 RepID=A0A1G6GUL1_9GAMM|nr:hypothetical protein SAMN05421733_102249 [Acinetobacter boissieri]
MRYIKTQIELYTQISLYLFIIAIVMGKLLLFGKLCS